MSLRSLRILSVIARKGSFAAAAEYLGLTQSAISLQIKNLETELGVLLFERTGHRPKLNTNGRLVVERANEILAVYEGIKNELQPQDDIGGTLVIGAVPTVLTGPLPSVVKRLRQRYENLNVKLRSGLSAELCAKVEDGELDAALTTEPPFAVAPYYEWQPYDTEPFFVVAPKGTKIRSLAELFSRYPFVRFDTTAWAGALVNSRLTALHIYPRDIVEIDSLEATLNLVEQGLGIAVVPLNQRRHLFVRSQFSLGRFGEPQLTRRVGMYQKRRHGRRNQTELMLKELRQECSLINT